jgi:hypothetical protein
MAGTIEKLKAKVDNVLHKDKTTTHTGTTGTHGTAGLGNTHGSDPTGKSSQSRFTCDITNFLRSSQLPPREPGRPPRRL